MYRESGKARVHEGGRPLSCIFYKRVTGIPWCVGRDARVDGCFFGQGYVAVSG